jgi:hypothetical protein
LIFTITFDKNYFLEDCMSFYFSTQRDDNYVYNRAIYNIYPDGSEKWFGTREKVITERNVKVYPDHYEVTLRCGNVNAKIFRYSLEVRNAKDEHIFVVDRVLTCNTLDCLDMTKYCEVHLSCNRTHYRVCPPGTDGSQSDRDTGSPAAVQRTDEDDAGRLG